MSHINDLPEGSCALNVETNYGCEIYLDTLNDLANDTASEALNYANLAAMTHADVSINLGPISTDGVTSKICLVSSDESYEQVIPAGFTSKFLLFKRIPASFLASFTVKNSTGTNLFSADNSITIRPIFE